ncbi:MAG: AMP-binding protein [Rhodobiaceae bacterium]|jgi:fatty-acyl-CoA synthase/long-chain acyl-CoA synthetase|nr:AMP-binding protein [Rhodobiaceae bacterium]|tara:strand:+ start:1139 stop:1741 length:603 start_codon:yes stop_codon:yes gene_type:complete
MVDARKFAYGLTLGGILTNALKRNADKTALVYSGAEFSYSELNHQSSRAAQGLLELGIKRGDSVAILLRNCVEYAVTDLAIIKRGAVKVPLNELLSRSEVDNALTHSSSVAVIVHASLLDRVSPRPGLTIITVSDMEHENASGTRFADLLSSAPITRFTPAEPDAPAVLMYTGGTTGRPKDSRSLGHQPAGACYVCPDNF